MGTWLTRMVMHCSAILLASNLLLGQGQWKRNNCTGTAPTLDRILINSCTSFEPDEYLIFHTNQSSFNVKGNQFSVQVNVAKGPYISNEWSSNPDALEIMNRSTGCKKPLFLDPFDPPYNGIIPAHANVMAFVQQNPRFSGPLSGLCDREAIFVIFGNFTPGFIKSMFANTCGTKPGCTRNIVVTLGSCAYDIIYEPDQFKNKNGDYIYGQGRFIRYATAANCKPVFNKFYSTPDPKVNAKELTICETDAKIVNKFTVLNGDDFTTWYMDMDMPPIARGPTFRPPANLFPPTPDGKPASRTIYVQNERGGRPSTPVELTLTNYPAPLSNAISLLCAPDPTCVYCKGGKVTVGIDINHTIKEGGFPYHGLLLSDGETIYPVTNPTPDINILELPPILSPSMTLHILSVENQYGCISTEGFGNDQIIINLKDSLAGYLPDIPDLCSNDKTYQLPPLPGGIAGQWLLNGSIAQKIDPTSMAAGTHTLYFKPEEECTAVDSVHFTIHSLYENEIILPSFDCNEKTYKPGLSRDSYQDGKWAITPSLTIDQVTGEVPVSEFLNGITYTWEFVSSDRCPVKTEAKLLIPDCSCSLEIKTQGMACHDNNTPVDSTDDTFTFDISVTGQNHSRNWETSDGILSGEYDIAIQSAAYPISEGRKSLTIQDQVDSACLVSIIIDPPTACSNTCDIIATVSDIRCHDNNTPVDSTDDTFTFDISVTGQNHSRNWETSDGLLSGEYDIAIQSAAYPISEGSISLTIRDQVDPGCKTIIDIEPPGTCSHSCNIEIGTRDSCHMDATGHKDIYYFLEINLSVKNPQFWIYHENKLIDIIPGKSDIALGPFSEENIGDILTVLYNDNPNCLQQIPLPKTEYCSLQNPVMPKIPSFPNAFTPNQDNHNDVWAAQLPPDCELVSSAIYDRWGNKIFTVNKSDVINGKIVWNGESGQQEAEPGTYLYRIIWRQTGKIESKSGQIILIR